ncbi:MAG: hypothetical protein PHE56_08185 [Bacteroidales bacterium]|nr:hypothetical protein [Bacteroidales bacterium]
MQIYDFIKQRMQNMGFDSNFILEPEVILFDGTPQMIDASNVFYYLYDVSNYEAIWKIECDTEIIFNHKFIIEEKIPYGIIELTGNIYITSSENNPQKFFFYKCTPEGLQQGPVQEILQKIMS